MSKRKINRIKFFAIKRDLASTHRRMEDIAADHGVSASTVGNVNQAVTWENHLAHKKSRRPIRSGRVKASDPLVRREKAVKAGLKPVTPEERSFQIGLKKLNEPDPIDQVKYKVEIHDSRLNALRELNTAATQRLNRQSSRIGWLWLLVLAAIVLGVVN